jgi:hypothetical protein
MIKRKDNALNFISDNGIVLQVIPNKTAKGANEYRVFDSKGNKVGSDYYTDLEDALTAFHEHGGELSDKDFNELVKYDNYDYGQENSADFKKHKGLRKFDDFNDRHGKNNPHDHNDNYYFDEASEDYSIEEDDYVMIDEDGKVLSSINDNVDFYDTVDYPDGGYSVAITFGSIDGAYEVAEELGIDTDSIEVIPAKEAFSFVDEFSSKKVETSNSKVGLLNKLWNIKG